MPRGDRDVGLDGGADRLGRVAHRHAGQEPDAALILGAFITPPYLGAIGWILLAGPNAGWLNRAWMAITGSHGGFINVYSFGGLVLVTALYAFPYIFVFTTDALERVSSEMEEAANILGAGGMRTIFRVTLPLVTPAILGGAIVVFLDTVALFGTPAIIALPARIRVMTLAACGSSSSFRCRRRWRRPMPSRSSSSRSRCSRCSGSSSAGAELRGADRQRRQPRS